MEHGFQGCIAMLETELAALSSMQRDTLIASRPILGMVPRLPEQDALALTPQPRRPGLSPSGFYRLNVAIETAR